LSRGVLVVWVYSSRVVFALEFPRSLLQATRQTAPTSAVARRDVCWVVRSIRRPRARRALKFITWARLVLRCARMPPPRSGLSPKVAGASIPRPPIARPRRDALPSGKGWGQLAGTVLGHHCSPAVLSPRGSRPHTPAAAPLRWWRVVHCRVGGMVSPVAALAHALAADGVAAGRAHSCP
jgi:hypothetical protein